jgi:hypothetical protein
MLVMSNVNLTLSAVSSMSYWGIRQSDVRLSLRMRTIRARISVIVHPMAKVMESNQTGSQGRLLAAGQGSAMRRDTQIKQRGMFCPCGRFEKFCRRIVSVLLFDEAARRRELWQST